MSQLPAFNNPAELEVFVAEHDVIATEHGRWVDLTEVGPIMCGWLIEDKYDYNPDPKVISLTTAIGPTILAVFKERYHKLALRDVTDMADARIGTEVHAGIAASIPRIAPVLEEERLTAPLGNGFSLSGQADAFMPLWYALGMTSGNDHVWVNSDHKNTSVYKLIKRDFKDYDWQINGGALLVHLVLGPPYRVVRGEINAILKDWSFRKAAHEQDYPKAKIVKIPIDTIRPMEEIQEYFVGRTNAIAKARTLKDSELKPCTPEERWEKDTEWAVKKRGAKTARAGLGKLFKPSRGETFEDAMEYHKKVGTDKYDLETRPGERTRCDHFCAYRAWCPLYR